MEDLKREIYCQFVGQVNHCPAGISPRRRNPEKALSLVTRAYIKESTYSLNIQSYSQYRKNLDLGENVCLTSGFPNKKCYTIDAAHKVYDIPPGPMLVALFCHFLKEHNICFVITLYS